MKLNREQSCDLKNLFPSDVEHYTLSNILPERSYLIISPPQTSFLQQGLPPTALRTEEQNSESGARPQPNEKERSLVWKIKRVWCVGPGWMLPGPQFFPSQPLIRQPRLPSPLCGRRVPGSRGPSEGWGADPTTASSFGWARRAQRQVQPCWFQRRFQAGIWSSGARRQNPSEAQSRGRPSPPGELICKTVTSDVGAGHTGVDRQPGSCGGRRRENQPGSVTETNWTGAELVLSTVCRCWTRGDRGSPARAPGGNAHWNPLCLGGTRFTSRTQFNLTKECDSDVGETPVFATWAPTQAWLWRFL